MVDIVKVINRTGSPVEFQYDGDTIVVDKEKHMPKEIAFHGLHRTPVMGTDGMVSKLGIEGITDISPLEGKPTTNEFIDRNTLDDPNAKKVKSLTFNNTEAQAELRARARQEGFQTVAFRGQG